MRYLSHWTISWHIYIFLKNHPTPPSEQILPLQNIIILSGKSLNRSPSILRRCIPEATATFLTKWPTKERSFNVYCRGASIWILTRQLSPCVAWSGDHFTVYRGQIKMLCAGEANVFPTNHCCVMKADWDEIKGDLNGQWNVRPVSMIFRDKKNPQLRRVKSKF